MNSTALLPLFRKIIFLGRDSPANVYLLTSILLLSLLSCNSQTSSSDASTQMATDSLEVSHASLDSQAKQSNAGPVEEPLIFPLPFGHKYFLYDYSDEGKEKSISKIRKEEEQIFKLVFFDRELKGKIWNNELYDGRYQPNEQVSFDLDYEPVLANTNRSGSINHFQSVGRLPDIGSNKVLLYKLNEHDDPFGSDERIDLVVLDKNKRVMNSLNLARDHGTTDGWSHKVFYVDKDYVIHLKYFLESEMGPLFTAYIMYKLLPDGSIIRYFKQDRGMYESPYEKGMVENHTKVGEWKERFGEYSSENDGEGGEIITFEGVYAVTKYEKGKPVGERVFYEFQGDDYNSNKVVLKIDTRTGKILQQSLPAPVEE